MKAVIKKATTVIGAILCLGSLVLTILWSIGYDFIERFGFNWSSELFAYISFYIIPALLLAIYFFFGAFSKKCPQILVRLALVFSFVSIHNGVTNGLAGINFYYYEYSDYDELTFYVRRLILSAIALVAVIVLLAVKLKSSKKNLIIIGIVAAIVYAVAGSYSVTDMYGRSDDTFYLGYVCLATSLPLVYIAALCDCKAKGRQDEAKNTGISSQPTDQPVAPPCSTNPYGIDTATPGSEVAVPSNGGVVRITSANFCSNCGNKLDGDEKYCQHCGYKVT